jgi:hypothetical protein
MSWAGIASNQGVSCNNLQDAVTTSVFILKSAIPVSTKQITKAEADTYVQIDTTYAPYAAKASNQLVVKNDLVAVTVYQLNISCDGTTNALACGLSTVCTAYTTVQTPVFGTIFYANVGLTALYDFSAYTGGLFIKVNSYDGLTGDWSCRMNYATSSGNNTPQSCP